MRDDLAAYEFRIYGACFNGKVIVVSDSAENARRYAHERVKQESQWLHLADDDPKILSLIDGEILLFDDGEP